METGQAPLNAGNGAPGRTVGRGAPGIAIMPYRYTNPCRFHRRGPQTAMLQKLILPIVIFLIVLIALTFGETIGREALAWFSYLTGVVIHNFSDLYWAVYAYFTANTAKIVIALLLTVPISVWIIKKKGDQLDRPASQRKIAIVLAIFLGWLGAHRFYLGQIGWGIVFLIVLYLFPPLAIAIGLIDALRYMFMSDDDFAPRQP